MRPDASWKGLGKALEKPVVHLSRLNELVISLCIKLEMPLARLEDGIQEASGPDRTKLALVRTEEPIRWIIIALDENGLERGLQEIFHNVFGAFASKVEVLGLRTGPTWSINHCHLWLTV
jgi:hypothetical protein